MTDQLSLFDPPAAEEVPELLVLPHVPQSHWTEGMYDRHCRSCGARIWWAETDKTRTAHPVDYLPDPRRAGNVMFVAPGIIRYGSKAEPIPEDEPVYTNHFVTCPQRREWRKGGKGNQEQAAETKSEGVGAAETPSEVVQDLSDNLEGVEAAISALAESRRELLEEIRRISLADLWPAEKLLYELMFMPDPDTSITEVSRRKLEAVKAIEVIRHGRLADVNAALVPLLDERDRHWRGAFGAGSGRPVDLRMAERAKERREASGG